MLQNVAFAVDLQDDQNSFRPTITPITPPCPLFLRNSSVFGAHSANIFTPSAVPNISLDVNGLFSVRLNSLALCDLACEQGAVVRGSLVRGKLPLENIDASPNGLRRYANTNMNGGICSNKGVVGNFMKTSLFNSRIFQNQTTQRALAIAPFFQSPTKERTDGFSTRYCCTALFNFSCWRRLCPAVSGGTRTTPCSYIQVGYGIGNSGRIHTKSRMGGGKLLK